MILKYKTPCGPLEGVRRDIEHIKRGRGGEKPPTGHCFGGSGVTARQICAAL